MNFFAVLDSYLKAKKFIFERAVFKRYFLSNSIHSSKPKSLKSNYILLENVTCPTGVYLAPTAAT